ncbi:MAG: hypothetical protein JWL81_2261 [Verrucomicrobiales bacterium]|nr:hypothetical protein [Verrucomicrobiales bacterium]
MRLCLHPASACASAKLAEPRPAQPHDHIPDCGADRLLTEHGTFSQVPG